MRRINLTDGGHGDHQEIDTVPVREALAVAKIRRITGILKLDKNVYFLLRMEPKKCKCKVFISLSKDESFN